ncbi:hypothetical protein JZ751_029090, partial [Albula glossodonta]
MSSLMSSHDTDVFSPPLCLCVPGDKDGSKVTTVVATPGQGPDRPQEVSYTDTKVIGNGSFGVVYQAKLCDSGELVAIKKVLQDKRFKQATVGRGRGPVCWNDASLLGEGGDHTVRPQDWYLAGDRGAVPHVGKDLHRHPAAGHPRPTLISTPIHWENRELQIMRKLDHCNIVRLRYFFYSSGDKTRLQRGRATDCRNVRQRNALHTRRTARGRQHHEVTPLIRLVKNTVEDAGCGEGEEFGEWTGSPRPQQDLPFTAVAVCPARQDPSPLMVAGVSDSVCHSDSGGEQTTRGTMWWAQQCDHGTPETIGGKGTLYLWLRSAEQKTEEEAPLQPPNGHAQKRSSAPYGFATLTSSAVFIDFTEERGQRIPLSEQASNCRLPPCPRSLQQQAAAGLNFGKPLPSSTPCSSFCPAPPHLILQNGGRLPSERQRKDRGSDITSLSRSHPHGAVFELKPEWIPAESSMEQNYGTKDEVYLNLVLDYVPETVYRVARHYSRAKQTLPMVYVKNLLLDPETAVLKLCDFGRCRGGGDDDDDDDDDVYGSPVHSAKQLVRGEPNVSYICSRYYRAPELIFGATDYTSSIDVWSAGCVLAELLLGQPIFPGDSGVDQLVEIIKVFRPRTPPEAIALCSRLLEYTPTARLTPLEACAHSFFDELRDPNVKLPNGREKPSLFNFTTQELSSNPSLASILIPAHARSQAGASTPTNASATSVSSLGRISPMPIVEIAGRPPTQPLPPPPTPLEPACIPEACPTNLGPRPPCCSLATPMSRGGGRKKGGVSFLTTSIMRGVTSGWMSWICRSCLVYSSFMVRISVKQAMILGYSKLGEGKIGQRAAFPLARLLIEQHVEADLADLEGGTFEQRDLQEKVRSKVFRCASRSSWMIPSCCGVRITGSSCVLFTLISLRLFSTSSSDMITERQGRDLPS